jgi:hypothetical protein
MYRKEYDVKDVIKGKLIYLKDDNGDVRNNDQLLHLLKQNKITNKEYLKGNQAEILKKISSNESEKEN